MAEQLGAVGMTTAGDGEHPDVVVVNTCTVTREATKASRMAIRRSARAHPDAKIVVVGCYAVSDRAEVEAIEGVDLVFGNDEKESFAEALAQGGIAAPAAPVLQLGFRPPDPAPAQPAGVRVRANLKAQTGCDEWCSFCIIPTTRGPLRSMDEDGLIAEAAQRVAAGARELVLTGVHLGKYEYDKGGDESSLVRLFARLLAIEGVQRLRLSSILSRHLTRGVLEFMAAEPRMCRYLHVPLQSGDDGVLAAMNRPYRIGEYIASLERAKQMLPGVALATDVIIGFPGESDDAFAATMDVVRRIEYSKLHVFRYSARPGTAAAGRPDSVRPEVKKQRSKVLIALGNDIRGRFLREHLREPLEVLVEEQRFVEGTGVSSGQTGDHIRVWFEGEGLVGRTVLVQGEGIRADGIRGRMVA
jgi:threonylcarbamoyladenosine tRNA methylthiotransferase MtaB